MASPKPPFPNSNLCIVNLCFDLENQAKPSISVSKRSRAHGPSGQPSASWPGRQWAASERPSQPDDQPWWHRFCVTSRATSVQERTIVRWRRTFIFTCTHARGYTAALRPMTARHAVRCGTYPFSQSLGSNILRQITTCAVPKLLNPYL